jgi:hypothetical protein
MNVFVLCTGRCGSETFARACRHMSNYTVAHEGQNPSHHPEVRQPYHPLKYPDNHIEVDNRLSWFLGTLDKEYGKRAFYVHLLRNCEEVAGSLINRGKESILFSFAWGVLQHYHRAYLLTREQRQAIGVQYWQTVNDNIEFFLRDKPHKMTMWLHDIKRPFADFWEAIGAEGDLTASLSEWDVRHNATRSGPPTSWSPAGDHWVYRLSLANEEITRVVPPGETFILADEDLWGSGPDFAGRRRIPFPEEGGQYGGPPAGDDTAIAEFERLREAGASFLVLAWPAFWWLEHYHGLNAHLHARYRRVLANDRLVVFDLRR